MEEVDVVGILVVVGLEQAVDKAFQDARCMGGMWWEIVEEMHRLMVGCGYDFVVFVDGDSKV